MDIEGSTRYIMRIMATMGITGIMDTMDIMDVSGCLMTHTRTFQIYSDIRWTEINA